LRISIALKEMRIDIASLVVFDASNGPCKAVDFYATDVTAKRMEANVSWG
jgi:hypothetical protein